MGKQEHRAMAAFNHTEDYGIVFHLPFVNLWIFFIQLDTVKLGWSIIHSMGSYDFKEDTVKPVRSSHSKRRQKIGFQD